MSKITVKALEKAEKGGEVYTPGAFCKSYQVVSKIFPSLWMMRSAKNFIKSNDDILQLIGQYRMLDDLRKM